MTSTQYRSAPSETTGMPGGIPFIVGNEAAERFSFYGMKTILAVFMTQYLVSSAGTPDYMTQTQAREYVALFVASAYFFPIIGALIADAFLGKYLTIMILSVVYCLGHGALALIDLPSPFLQATFEPKTYMVIGLLLIAVGSGGIKPCVSAHVGDQFGKSNSHLLSKVFGWFYFSINFGSFFSTLLTPWLLKHYGPGWAFGVPGILMALATFVFWLGRHRYIHIRPKGLGFVTETFSREGLGAILRLVSIYAFVAVFWSLYDQSGGAWVLQASQMNTNFLGITWLESQVQAINPLLILCYIPLFSYVVYPLVGKVVRLTPLRKIGAGLFLTVVAFGISATVQQKIDAEQSAFLAKIEPMVATGAIDIPRTKEALGAVERNATILALDALSAKVAGNAALAADQEVDELVTADVASDEVTAMLERHAATQTVQNQGLVRLSDAQLEGQPRVLDAGPARGARAAVVPRDEDVVCLGLGDTRRHRADTDLGDELDRDARGAVGRLEVVDQLRQVLDGVDVVVRRGRDEADAGSGAARLGDELGHLVPGQLAALTRLGALRHLDLDLVRIGQVLGGDAEAAGGDLLGGGPPVVLEAQRVLTALARVGLAAE